MDDPYRFYSYDDLVDRRIVVSRQELARLIHERGFPNAIKSNDTVQARARWRQIDVHAWLDRLAAQQNNINTRDSLTEPVDRPRRPRGRPRKQPQAATAAE
jgi:predicted DNA-binding transcriptional regulator AlpA